MNAILITLGVLNAVCAAANAAVGNYGIAAICAVTAILDFAVLEF